MWSEHSTTDPTHFQIGRYSDNELILFDEERKESWIVYPPRSAYPDLKLRRRGPRVTLVEHHPWAPFARPVDHHVDAKTACLDHGLECDANAAIQNATSLGFDPFG